MDIQTAIETLKDIQLDYPNKDFDMARHLAIQALESQLKDKWIPVSERLPKSYNLVLVTSHDYDLYITYYTDEGWHSGFNTMLFANEPLAWKPLPEPYKDDEQ